MGCVVNGPGEAREADLGIAAGRGRATSSCGARSCGSFPRPTWSTRSSRKPKILAEGIEARIAAADENAEAIAAATRDELLQIQGIDANPAGPRRSPRSATSRIDPRRSVHD